MSLINNAINTGKLGCLTVSSAVSPVVVKIAAGISTSLISNDNSCKVDLPHLVTIVLGHLATAYVHKKITGSVFSKESSPAAFYTTTAALVGIQSFVSLFASILYGACSSPDPNYFNLLVEGASPVFTRVALDWIS